MERWLRVLEVNSTHRHGDAIMGVVLTRQNSLVFGDPVSTGERIDIPVSCLRQDVMKPGEYVPPNDMEE